MRGFLHLCPSPQISEAPCSDAESFAGKIRQKQGNKALLPFNWNQEIITGL
jgi:hypothetical protein